MRDERQETKDQPRSSSALLILGLIAAALIFYVLAPPRPAVHAQQANVQFATAAQSLTITMATGQTETTNITANIGQTAHSVSYRFGSTLGTGCFFWLEGSYDSLTWVILAAGSDYQFTSTVTASGYYPLLKIVTNPNGGLAGCNAHNLVVNYLGSLLPFAPDPTGTGYFANSFFVNNALQICGLGQNTCAASPTKIVPQVLGGVGCYNTTASTIYLQVYFSQGVPPTPFGNGAIMLPVPATSFTAWSGPPLESSTPNTQLWVVATTTWNGSTTPGPTALWCNFYLNPFGPFLPVPPFGI
jgi:hypothetical protein